MVKLTINGRQVTVDDSFLQLSPEQQEATVEEIAASFGQDATEQQQETGGYGSQIFSGLMEGATGALGAPIDLVNNLLVAPAASGINALFGTDIQPSQTPLGGGAGLRQGLAIAPESESGGQQFARRVAQSVGGAAPFAAGASSAGQVASLLGTGLGGGIGGATAQQIAPDNIGAEIAGELIGGLGAGAAISGLANRSARRAAEKAVPSIEELKEQAGDLYRAAESRGVVASKQMTADLADDITKIARDAELITPTGRVSDQYPKAKEAMQLMKDYSGFDMNPTQMQRVRETLSDAAFNTDGNEARIAKKMLKAFDDFTAPLAPELRQARDISSRYLKAGKLETMRELAENTQYKFSQSGMDNAIRQEYKKLSDNIIKGREGGWSPKEIEAINKVTKGTGISRAASYGGKLAPRGVVSLSAGTLAPAAAAGSLFGPGVGTAVGAAIPAFGFASQAAASSMRSGYADVAELLARSGGTLPNASNPAIRDAVIQALIGSQLAAQSNTGVN